MNECLTTPQHEKQIGYWVSEKGEIELKQSEKGEIELKQDIKTTCRYWISFVAGLIVNAKEILLLKICEVSGQLSKLQFKFSDTIACLLRATASRLQWPDAQCFLDWPTNNYKITV